jgi:hypothetical protein
MMITSPGLSGGPCQQRWRDIVTGRLSQIPGDVAAAALRALLPGAYWHGAPCWPFVQSSLPSPARVPNFSPAIGSAAIDAGLPPLT